MSKPMVQLSVTNFHFVIPDLIKHVLLVWMGLKRCLHVRYPFQTPGRVISCQNEQSYHVFLTSEWFFVPEWKSCSVTCPVTGVTSHRCGMTHSSGRFCTGPIQSRLQMQLGVHSFYVECNYAHARTCRKIFTGMIVMYLQQQYNNILFVVAFMDCII